MAIWNRFEEVLPLDKQKIIIYHEGLKVELQRTFYKDFWDKYNYSLDCDQFCKKWRSQ